MHFLVPDVTQPLDLSLVRHQLFAVQGAKSPFPSLSKVSRRERYC
jgi:hypothetical protein